MILSYKRGFVFVKGRKVAGTSLEVALSRLCGPTDVITPITPVDEHLRLTVGRACQNFCDDRALELRYRELVGERCYAEALRTGVHNPRRVTFVNHSSLQEIEDRSGIDPARFALIYCVRNPYAKIVSLANMKLSFRDYDGRPMINPTDQVREAVGEIMEKREFERLDNTHLYETKRKYAATVVLRQERLEEDFERLRADRFPHDDLRLPHVKQGASLLGLAPEDVFSTAHLRVVNDYFRTEFELYGYRPIPA